MVSPGGNLMHIALISTAYFYTFLFNLIHFYGVLSIDIFHMQSLPSFDTETILLEFSVPTTAFFYLLLYFY